MSAMQARSYSILACLKASVCLMTLIVLLCKINFISGLPTEKLREKADEYIEAGLLTSERAATMMRVIEMERDGERLLNCIHPEDAAEQGQGRVSSRLSKADLEKELAKREAALKTGVVDGISDQWRVYQEIVNSISSGKLLRLMVQASAGTGKSFLLKTVYLWCF